MFKLGGPHVIPKTVFLLLSDYLLILLGLAITTALRFLPSGAIAENLLSAHVLLRFSWVTFVCYVSLYYNELYDFQVARQRSVMFVRLVQSLGIACFALALSYYGIPQLQLGRGIAALAVPTILVLLLGWRLLLIEKGFFLCYPERVLVVGTGQAGITLTREILARPEFSLQVVGFLDETGQNVGKTLVNPGIIGAVQELESVAQREQVDRVVLSLTERRGRMPLKELLRLKFSGIKVEHAHDLYEIVTGRILLEDLTPSWLILSGGFRKSRLVLAGKRAVDVMGAAVGLALALPLLVLIAVAICLETGMPILFRQKRVGWKGRTFEMLKFRSMVQTAEANGPSWAVTNDRRVTRVGRFLRRYRLDELPQLFNVLRGDMSVVGPRPEQPHFCELLEKEIPLFPERHSVRPGLTGWAQIKYKYGSSLEEAKSKLEFDLFYIKHLSLLLDLGIILETIKVLLFGRGAN